MRNVFVALALALVLIVPQAPAPARAGTFEITIETPLLILIEADAALENITGIACIGTAGSPAPWLAIKLITDDVIVAFAGETAKLKDKPAKLKATFSDRAKKASSGDIQRLDQDSSGKEVVNTSEDVKATMTGKATEYVVDPENEAEFVGTSGKIKVKDQTNGEKVVLNANVAAKVTEGKGSCSVELDTNGQAVSARASGVTEDGKRLDIRLGR